jgi:tungstate transport system permease protein
MDFLLQGLKQAFLILFSFDAGFLSIIWVSLRVSLASVGLAAAVGVPLGAVIAFARFPGRRFLITAIHTLMSIPTVLVGLLVYALISRQGPLGGLELLYTLRAMVMGQCLLSLPIITGLTISAVRGLDARVLPTAQSLGASPVQSIFVCAKEARFGLAAALIAGFSRVFAEIGVSMMLGGNIKGYTRNITTAIALESSKGDYGLAVALGFVLLAVALSVNILFSTFQRKAE